ncbi:MAG TPA: hypothetical protein VEI06_01955 [Gemmatimonadaceae bacterium]|nr:hypothetical protein [Gemmatimonadaceae bacterium]
MRDAAIAASLAPTFPIPFATPDEEQYSMKIGIVAAVLISSTVAPLCAAAAQNTLAGIAYSTGLPTGNTKSYIDNFSWVGASFEGRRLSSSHFSIGLQVSWNEFYHKESGTFTLPNGAITGTQYRNINSFSGGATVHLYGGSPGHARIYAGTGINAYYMKQLLDVGLYSSHANNWHFGFSPQVGILLPSSATRYLHLSVTYNYPLSGGNYLGGGARSFQYWTFSLGVMGGGG